MLDVLDDEADRCGPLPPPETPSDIVGSISESGHRVPDARRVLRAHPRLLVHDPRDGLQANPRDPGHVHHRRRLAHPPPSKPDRRTVRCPGGETTLSPTQVWAL